MHVARTVRVPCSAVGAYRTTLNCELPLRVESPNTVTAHGSTAQQDTAQAQCRHGISACADRPLTSVVTCTLKKQNTHDKSQHLREPSIDPRSEQPCGAAGPSNALPSAIASAQLLRPPSCRSPSKSLLFILCRESTGQGFFCLAVRALRCADGGAAAVPCSHAFGSPDLDSRLARTFFITLCTSRSPLWMILVLVRAVHHDAVPPAVASARYPQTGPAAGLLACRPPHADQPVGQSQQRRAP